MRVKYKSKGVMGDYIAIHGYGIPYLRKNVPKGEIWIRKDIHDRNPRRAKRIERHEIREIRYMRKGMPYKSAHRRARY